ncbi:glucuronate isomerase [Pseudarthrobacter sp. NPDC080039]|uniref:glucuronate isomerase n=1 Tax=unclassified Pseudarthrobacter TaxID=2647000 RepID=UPI003450800D
MTELTIHPDRLLPSDPATRAIARSLLGEVEAAPIYSPHGHVDPAWLADNKPFNDPATLLITPDHYVTRMLHAAGVPLSELGVSPLNGGAHPADPRDIWRSFSEKWHLFLGTPVRYWMEQELNELFGINEQPDAGNADEIFDTIQTALQTDEFRPRELFKKFNIAVLATTDDPVDDLSTHRLLRDDPSFTGRVLPTFRPDRYLDPAAPGWTTALDRLHNVSGIDTSSYAGLLAALKARRQFFKDHGATATDSGCPEAGTEPLSDPDAQRLHLKALRGQITDREAVAYRRNMLYQMAAMSAEDGLVMQLHPGIFRNHHRPTFNKFGPDTGHDLPTRTSFVEPLRPLLESFGTHPNFRMVLFTVDETAFSREIAPLAGFYPSVYVGAPWWFLDTPAAISRFRSAVTDSAGFYKTAGFVDDTRAFCSIPARHNMARRADAAHLATLVTTHQITETDAHTLARDLVGRIPTDAFRL